MPFAISMALSCSVSSAVRMLLMAAGILHRVDPQESY